MKIKKINEKGEIMDKTEIILSSDKLSAEMTDSGPPVNADWQ